jgi:YD repeat-containing protein
MIRSRSERDGKLEYSTDDYCHEEVRDAEGRLVKYVSGRRGEPARETYNTYDDAGRLLTTTNNQNSDRTEYSYGPDGLRMAVHTFDPKTIERTRHTAFCGSPWEAAVFSGGGVPSGGTVTIQYDKDDGGTEMRVLTADGQVVTHIVRKYDAVGHILEEKPLQQNIALLMLDRMPPEQRAAFTPEQIEAWNASMGGKQPSLTTYSYDDEGRFTGKVDRNQFFEEIKTVRYNVHGDRIEERRTIKENSRMPIRVPHSVDAEGKSVPSQPVAASRRSPLDEDTSTSHSYEYDGYGNWTERTETRNDGFTVTTRRTLTYY